MDTAPREQWSGRAAFVLATVASAVGLGNIWRFSYVAGVLAGFLASPQTVAWQLLVLALATAAVIAGVRSGIERVARTVMPLLAVIAWSCRQCSPRSSPAAC
jgi:SNF family Na+-dependent transporter